MTRSSLAIGALVALASLAAGGDAAAYCRTTSCGQNGTGQKCNPQGPGDCGIELFWTSPCVGFSVQKDASKDVTFDTTEQVMATAFATWMNAACDGGGHPRIKVVELDSASCSKHEYNQQKANTNLIVYRDTAWPYEGSSSTLALTTVTYNLDTGEIYDADMELNSADHHFTTDDVAVQYDLLSVITHETGHFLGLAHSAESDATMFTDYKQGDKSLRDLTADDIAGICAIYPPGAAIPPTCDPTPRHGFSPLCASEQPEPAGTGGSDGGTGGGCATASGGRTSGGEAFVAALGLLGLAARSRRPGRRR
ncbi:MAG: matrixin family metalloprotease [Byssovorax sp.]